MDLARLCVIILTTFGVLGASARPAWGARVVTVDPKKLTVCSATINSSEEKELFQKYLNPNEFQFVELVTPESGGNSEAWFDRACESNISCDILLISGHFGDTFFGSTGVTLSLDALEKHSCSKDCGGILSNPREVFLLGCNTLAARNKDHRTPEEYARVLMQDGFSRPAAERMTEGRYGAFGQENRDRMRRAFQNVPHLFGFDSVGPSGKNVSPRLKKYLLANADYAAHLEQDAVEQLTRGVVSLNQELANTMHHTSFSQCSGLRADDPAYDIHARLCTLFDCRKPPADRLSVAEEMLKSENWMIYLPSVESFLRDLPAAAIAEAEAKQIFNRIVQDETVKTSILDSISKLKMPGLKLERVALAHRLNWISDEAFAAASRADVMALLKPKMNLENRQIICALNPEVKKAAGIQSADIDKNYLKSEHGLAVIRCLNLATTDTDIRGQLLNTLKTLQPSNENMMISVLLAIGAPVAPENSPAVDASFEQEVVRVLKMSNLSHRLKAAALSAFEGIGMRRSESMRIIAKHAINAMDADIRLRALLSLQQAKSLPTDVLKSITPLALDIDEDVRAAATTLLEAATP